jgi:hypothetical protein
MRGKTARCARAASVAVFLLTVSVGCGSSSHAVGTRNTSHLASTALAGQWNRLNPDRSNPAPEHEHLYCSQVDGAKVGTGADTWRCQYDKIPQPTLNFHWNSTRGSLSGRDATATWSCPSWFPAGICRNVVQVVEGKMAFLHPPLTVVEDLVVSHTGNGQRLYVYWADRFECPWFRTFARARAANPLPLPFNGTGPRQDCVFPGPS